MELLPQILITIAAVAGSNALWQFMSERIKNKASMHDKKILNDDGLQYRDDLKKRVSNLESLLLKSTQEKDDLNSKVLTLTAQVSELRVKVDFLEKENERLKMK